MLSSQLAENLVYRIVGKKWIKSSSDLNGYDIVHRLRCDDSSYIQTYLNRQQKLVRLSITLPQDLSNRPKKTILAIVTNGKILVQGEYEKGKILHKRIAKLVAPYVKDFYDLKDKKTLETIGGAFRIPLHFDAPKEKTVRPTPKLQLLWQAIVKRRLLKKKKRSSSRIISEIFDFGLGFLLIYFTGIRGYFIQYDSILWVGAWGIIVGWIDIYIRKRTPFLIKVYFFVAVSAYLIYESVQKRLFTP